MGLEHSQSIAYRKLETLLSKFLLALSCLARGLSTIEAGSNPFVKPVGESFWQQLPYKTINGVFGTPLNAIWDTVGRQLRPTVHPNSTSAKESASLDILALLEDKEVHGVVVEWTEGVVQRL
ncbi:hypothetical protein C8R42DRAFT_708467 [Lentinula raphanica]|nr:hypothetical protein C8R42DRAFT_708467 [Lentinula raphanica]